LANLETCIAAYESRLFKYRSHNFDAYWDSLDRSQINMVKCTLDAKPKKLKGLARLIFLEFVVAQYGDQRKYHQLRRLKKIQETGSEPTHSGYASHEIPYGQRFTAPRYASLSLVTGLLTSGRIY
jgi:hypothetical protein